MTTPAAGQASRALLLVFQILLFAVSLSGCGTLIKTAPPPVPTLILDRADAPVPTQKPVLEEPEPGGPAPASQGGVTASGVIAPGDQARLVIAAGGKVLDVLVKPGDRVQAGQVLLRLAGSERLAAAVEAASLEVLSSEQAQKELNRNAALERSAAQLRLANALKALDDAEKLRDWRNYRNGSDSSIDAARADFILASNAFENAQTMYGAVANNDEEDVSRAGALSALAAARKARDRALGNLNYLLAMPNDLEVGQAEAELQAALAEVESAKEEYERLKDGPDPDSWQLTEARVQSARAQLSAAQAALADLELSAPFAGTLAEVNIHNGEWAAPGQALLLLIDLEHMRVETTDLSELDVPLVAVGQEASVTIEALDATVNAKVIEIAPLPGTLGGDVVYKTTLVLDGVPDRARAGMSVEVRFQP